MLNETIRVRVTEKDKKKAMARAAKNYTDISVLLRDFVRSYANGLTANYVDLKK